MDERWIVEFHGEFEPEFEAMDEDVQDELLAAAKALQTLGPGFDRHLAAVSARKPKRN